MQKAANVGKANNAHQRLIDFPVMLITQSHPFTAQRTFRRLAVNHTIGGT